jgi:hypothetical protein
MEYRMSIDFNSRAEVPGDVLVSELDGESVILNLKTESYFGLDEVGAWMWSVVSGADSIEAGFQTLKGGCDVDPARLRMDLTCLLEQLLAEGLVRIDQ